MTKKAKQKRNKICSKSLKILFASSMTLALFSGIIVQGNSYSGADAESSATAQNVALVNGVEVALDQNLVDNNDGTYSLDLKTSSSLRYTDKSIKNTVAKYGFFKAKTTGDYLFEVWGGKGGDGEDTRYSDGGEGGEGAHLYASLNMQAGEYVFYTIGGNGEKTVSTSTGGGANGDGGDHGDTGSYYVGGGGGFTALYYFDSSNKTYFENNYLENGELIRTDVIESDRVTKYIMVAGGGGGGGAGNAFSLSNKAVRTADGGAAGGFNSPSGVLSGSSYKVPGTFYSGANGYSSGKNQDYIGKGGSNVPGEVNSTYFEWFNGKQPNDWEGAANPNYPGGTGGAGNLRGGAGGAGYAGGSGGIMAGLLLGYDVGGGGGGSSFISDKLNTSLTPNEQIFVTNKNESTTGGAVYITHVPDESAYTCLDDLTVNGEISEYFDITAINSTKGTVSLDGNKFTVANATSVPGTAITTSTETLLSLTLKPKAELMGGNDVPVFANNSIKYDYIKDSNPGTFNITTEDRTSYVNLPYKFELVTNNYTGVCGDDGWYKEKKASDLFVDNDYVSKKSTKGYTFINNITDYTIKDEDGKTYSKNETISIQSTKSFYISFTVTPKAGSKAIVGNRLAEKTYIKEAKISIIEVSKNILNGNEMSYTKTLNYNSTDNSYVLSVNVATSGQEKADSAEFPYSAPGTGSYTITTAGVYGLHAWGGNGGKGGDGNSGEEGLAGGSGGYYETKIYLDAGDVVTYSVGKNGDKGKSSSSILNCGGQGVGGIRSEVYVNGTKIIVAGGGGGGGGGTIKSGQSKGGDCEDLGDGTDGSPATSSPGSNSHKGGSAGTNYVNTAAIDAKNQGHDISDPYRYTPASYSATGNSGGAVYISPLAKNKTLSNYGVKADFTSDFNLTKVDITGATATKSDTNPNVTDIIPDDVVVGNTRYVDFTVKYTLTPNCLGGNDIKLLNALELNQVDCNGSTLDDKIDVAALDSTDYANVAINSSILSQFSLNTYEVDYLQGGEGVDVSSLADGTTSFTPTEKIEIVPYENSFPLVAGKVDPDITTEYVVNYGVRPTADPVKAVVGPSLNEQLITDVAKVNVYHGINFNVSHMKIEAEKENIAGEDVYVYTPGEDYIAKLTPEPGWDTPEDITLTIDGVEHPEYITIDDDGNIILTIPGSELGPNSDIQLTTNAKEKEYTIHYLVSLDATGLLTYDYTVKAKAGEDISSKVDALIAQYPPEGAPSITGYTFTVEYPDGTKPTTMGSADLWINGLYNPNPRTLTVHYVNMAGDTIAPDYVDPNTSCYYHKQYSLTPAEVTGYAPNYVKIGSTSAPISDLNAANPQFSMPDEDMELYIYYVAVNGKAVINYVCQDDIDNLPATVIIDDKAPGETYSVDSPIIPGYVASISTVSGTIQVDGEAITVTYVPVSHTISFDSKGGTEFDDRTVFYGHEVGYTGNSYAESTFEPLPTPVKIGYNFLGWYMNNSKVDASTVWELDGDYTLVAKWEKRSYTVTIRYSYDDDSGVVTPLKNVVLTGLYDTDYSYTHQNVVGYTTPAMTSGKYGASNINIDVTYTINYHDIIVHYLDNNGATLKADETSDIEEGCILTLRIAVPSELKGTNIKLVHIHSEDDISVIVPGEAAGIGTYIIDEEGFIVTQINKLSDFSIIYESPCIAHWFLLAIAILDVILLAAFIILNKKHTRVVGVIATTALIVISAVAGVFAHDLFCWIMLGVNGGLVITNIIYFAVVNRKDGEEKQPVPQVIYVNAPAQAQVQVQQAPIQAAPVAPVQEAAPVVPEDENKADLSLKDSMAQAKVETSDIVINKKTVANWLKENYPNKVIVGDVKPGMTSTGLPLADTHYTFIEGNKKCFIYVYEIDNKCFFIVRGNEDIARVVRSNGHKFISSAFPKTRDYAKWFTVLIDDSYKSSEDVFNTLRIVLAGLAGEAIVNQVPVEENKADLSLKDSMAEAKVSFSNVAINKQSVADWLRQNYKGQVRVGDVKPGMTSTGLPLADTHYTSVHGQEKCFIYVYEVDGKCFFIVRGDEDVAKAIRGDHHKFVKSAFPKTRDYASWYTMIIDGSYESSEEVFNALRLVISSLHGEKVAFSPKAEPIYEEPVADISLKDSMAQAKVGSSQITINKESIATWLKVYYPNKVIVGDVKPGMTSTGLPLADTHYVILGENKKCFIYVYDVDGKCFFIVRSNDDVAKSIRSKGHKFIKSAFPKTRDYASWYTVLVDDSYRSSEDVFETLKEVIANLLGESYITKEIKHEVPVAPVQEEENKADLSLKDSMAEAKVSFSNVAINKQSVADWLRQNYKGQVRVGDVKPGMTSTGLPLADTHYTSVHGQEKCFIYVYEVDGKCFFIVRGDEDVAKAIRGDHHKFVKSAFPKTRDYASWYTMIIDGSYSSSNEVFEELKRVVAKLHGESYVANKPVEVKAEQPKIEQPQEDLSLKDSISQAKIKFSTLSINKENVAEYLAKKYGDKVIVNTRGNMTSTGLPLADTHYVMINGQKKCFLYVYEIEGKCFLIAKSDEDVASKVREQGHMFISSSFPKTRDYAKWYTMLIDRSYKSNDDFFSVIDLIISKL